MAEDPPTRQIRADAKRSTARILEAAEGVLVDNANASLEAIADAAGVARVTVHRRFASRAALLDALAETVTQRHLLALEQARVRTAPPMVALYRLTEIVFGLKANHQFAMRIPSARTPEVTDGLDHLFARLRDSGDIHAASPRWSRQVYLALLHEVDDLPADAPELQALPDGLDTLEARVGLVVRSVIGALGGRVERATAPAP